MSTGRNAPSAATNYARNYKPDDKSRSAWELATHLATADMWFLDSVLNGKFEWDPDLKGDRKIYAAMLTAMDGAIGHVVAALEAKQMRQNTLFIFSSDNGGRSFEFDGWNIAT